MNEDTKKTVKKLKKLAPKEVVVPMHDDPVAELRVLRMQYQALVKTMVAMANANSDRKFKATDANGKAVTEVRPCRLPAVVQAMNKVHLEAMKKAKAKLVLDMQRQLKKVPLWNLWLGKVGGIGAPLGAMLLTCVDITKAHKPSKLNRYCGFAVMDGRLERRRAGEVGGYNADIRTAMFIAFSNMLKEGGKNRKNKYLVRWGEAKVGGIANGKTRGAAHKAGWHKAASLFLDDLYMVWRSFAGLGVYPNYYAKALGYQHGSEKVVVDAPRFLTVEEAIALVGDVSYQPGKAPGLYNEKGEPEDAEAMTDGEDEEALAVAAE